MAGFRAMPGCFGGGLMNFGKTVGSRLSGLDGIAENLTSVMGSMALCLSRGLGDSVSSVALCLSSFSKRVGSMTFRLTRRLGGVTRSVVGAVADLLYNFRSQVTAHGRILALFRMLVAVGLVTLLGGGLGHSREHLLQCLRLFRRFVLLPFR